MPKITPPVEPPQTTGPEETKKTVLGKIVSKASGFLPNLFSREVMKFSEPTNFKHLQHDKPPELSRDDEIFNGLMRFLAKPLSEFLRLEANEKGILELKPKENKPSRERLQWEIQNCEKKLAFLENDKSSPPGSPKERSSIEIDVTKKILETLRGLEKNKA